MLGFAEGVMIAASFWSLLYNWYNIRFCNNDVFRCGAGIKQQYTKSQYIYYQILIVYSGLQTSQYASDTLTQITNAYYAHMITSIKKKV